MALERRDTRDCYYAKRRVGKRVVSQYLGTGDVARVMAKVEKARQREKAHTRAQLEACKAAFLDIDRALATLQDQLRKAVIPLLERCGLYQHHGTWRLRMNATTQQADQELDFSTYRPSQDPEFLESIRTQMLERAPDKAREIAQAFRAPLSQSTRITGHLIQKMAYAPGDVERLRLEIDQLKVLYGYADAPISEQLMIEQIIISQLRLWLAEHTLDRLTPHQLATPLGRAIDRNVNSAHRRFVRSVEALTRVRRLTGKLNMATSTPPSQAES